jgi:hypothetical protein
MSVVFTYPTVGEKILVQVGRGRDSRVDGEIIEVNSKTVRIKFPMKLLGSVIDYTGEWTISAFRFVRQHNKPVKWGMGHPKK